MLDCIYIILIVFCLFRFLQARDMSILLGVKLMVENHIIQIKLLSNQESYLHQIMHLMKGDLLNMQSTF
jgi:hypothetical protein